MTDLFGEKYADALFSPCQKHRIWLNRVWDRSKPMVLFIGLNPSTANAHKPDNTITKVKKIANYNGFGGFYMMNLFTFISTDPDKLDIKNGNINLADRYLRHIATKCEAVVFAWGAFKVHGRDAEVRSMFPNAFALHINDDGSPKHPLYCKDETLFIPYHQVAA